MKQVEMEENGETGVCSIFKKLVECSPSGLSTRASTPMKQLIRNSWPDKRLALYRAIHMYEDQVFDDMSEESEKVNFERFIV